MKYFYKKPTNFKLIVFFLLSFIVSFGYSQVTINVRNVATCAGCSGDREFESETQTVTGALSGNGNGHGSDNCGTEDYGADITFYCAYGVPNVSV